ncbi:heparanase protein [Trifolium repens]|nr:heparanase protein [Trifolium repens]
MPINTDTDKNVGDKNKSKGLALLRDVLHKLTYTTKSLLNSQRIRRLKKQRKRTRNRSSRSLRRLKALPPSSPPPVKLSAGELTEAYSTVRFPGKVSKLVLPYGAPGGFYQKEWFDKLLQVSGSGVVDVITHHVYNLGPGSDGNLVNKILDPARLSKVETIFGNLIFRKPFINTVLDQLGISSKYNTKVYCRQTLIGGNYGLLNTTNFTPNPDYYTGNALLWHQLTGKSVLAVSSDVFSAIFMHFKDGVTFLLINLSNQTNFILGVHGRANVTNEDTKSSIHVDNSFFNHLKRAFSWVGTKGSDMMEKFLDWIQYSIMFLNKMRHLYYTALCLEKGYFCSTLQASIVLGIFVGLRSAFII